MEPIDVFIAYAKPDKVLVERLRKQLSAAERIGLVDAWHDGEIEIGTDKEEAAQKAMEEAEIVVLLLSADFFASEYLYEKEMKRALELSKANKTTVIPVLLKECTWQLTPIANLQILPKNGVPVTNEHWKHPDRAFKHVVDEIIWVSNQIRKEQGNPTMPYTTSDRKKDIQVEKTTNKTISQKEDLNKTPLWKLVLYAFCGLGAIALISFLINQVFTDNESPEPIGQNESIAQPKELIPEKTIDLPVAEHSEETSKKNPTQNEEKTTNSTAAQPSKKTDSPPPPKEQKSVTQKPQETSRDIPKSYEQTRTKEESTPDPSSEKEQTTTSPEVPKYTPPPFAIIKLGNLEWAAQNISRQIDNSWCYKDDSANCRKYGRLYNFEAALKLCPEGWRLPVKEEWLLLSKDDIAKLRLTKGGVYDRGSYRQSEQIGYYFTGVRSGGGEAWVIEFRGNEKPLQKDRRYVHWGMSCRCVR